MHRRIALVAGVALLLGALAFSFAPSNTDDAECGRWFAPEWTEAKSESLARKALDQIDGRFPEIDVRAQALADRVVRKYRQCSIELDARRNVSLGLLAGAILAPAGILYVGRREDQTATA